MDKNFKIETPRLIIRNWKSSDLPVFIAMNQDPEVMEFHSGSVLTPEDSRKDMASRQKEFKETGLCLWACELKTTGEFIGSVGLTGHGFGVWFGCPAIEIGWRLARAHWNKGYATEAAKGVLDWTFENLGLQEVIATTAVNNQRSRRVMDKLGMTHDPRDDFDHPKLSKDHAVSRQVLYRISRG